MDVEVRGLREIVARARGQVFCRLVGSTCAPRYPKLDSAGRVASIGAKEGSDAHVLTVQEAGHGEEEVGVHTNVDDEDVRPKERPVRALR
jgi:hypothetical protein